MQYWKRVDVGDFRKHADTILSVIDTSSRTFWNPLSKSDYDKIPDLLNDLSIYGEVREIASLHLYDEITTLHTDHTAGLQSGVLARLNLPVMNTEGSITQFYNFQENYKRICSRNKYGTVVWPANYTKMFKPVSEVEIIEPTIIRTSEPHFVRTTSKKYPRITLTVSFNPDISRLLE